MKDTFKKFVDIYTTSGRKDKETIIKSGKEDEKFLNLFKLSMDSYITFGVSETSFKNILDNDEFYYEPHELSNLFLSENEWNDTKYDVFVDEIIPYLIETNSPSKEVKTRLNEFFNGLNKVERYFYYRCIIKNMNLGIGPKTVNKVLGRILIELYQPMLADSGIEKFDKWDISEDTYYACDTKINGLRLTLFIDEDDIVIRTRSGLRFYYLEEYLKKYWLNTKQIKSIIKEVLNDRSKMYDELSIKEKGQKLALDCELQHKDKTWESSISVINLKEVDVYSSPLDDEPLFYLHNFDLTSEIPFKPENYDKECSTLPYEKRRELLEKLISSLPNDMNSKIFLLTDSRKIKSLEEVERLTKEWISDGFEGSVVKHPRSTYSCSRKSCWLKIKDIQTYDGTIIDTLTGDKSGKYHSVVAKLIVKVNIKGKELTGTVGSGFKDSDREMLSSPTVIGKTVEFTILGKTVKDNFQSGVFKGIRMDK